MNNRTKGIICIILSAFCFALMNACVRLAGDLPSVQKSFFRNFVAFFVALLLLLREGGGFRLQKGTLPFHLIRSAAGTAGILCNFYAIDHLLLANASMLNKMSPFFVLIFSFFLLRERMKPAQVLIVAAAFGGSLLIIQPVPSNLELWPSFLGLMGGMAAGLAYTMVRKMGLMGERSALIVFFFSGFSCLVTLPYLIFAYAPMTWAQFAALMGAGLAATGGQFGITKAYTYAPGREVSVYDYTQIIFAALLGWLLFGQVPDLWSALGYVVIVGAALVMFLYNNGLLYPKKQG